MAKRRAHGEGSIYKRKNGLWCGELRQGGLRRSVYGKTRRQVVEKILEARQRVAAGGPVEPDSTPFGQYSRRWLEGQASALKPRTVESYAYALGLVIKPLDRIPLGKVDPMTAEGAIAKLKSGRQRQLAYSVLHRLFGSAVDKGLIAANPMRRVVRPKYRAPEARALTPAESPTPNWTCRRLRHTALAHRRAHGKRGFPALNSAPPGMRIFAIFVDR